MTSYTNMDAEIEIIISEKTCDAIICDLKNTTKIISDVKKNDAKNADIGIRKFANLT